MVTVGGSAGWEIINNILYAPLIKKNHTGRSSRLFVTNVGAAFATAYTQFYDTNGMSVTTVPNNLAAGGLWEVSPPTNCPSQRCSAKLWSSNGQPLAAAVIEYADSTNYARTTHNTFSSGALSNYVPLVKKNAAGQTTRLAVQNLGAKAA